MSAYGLHLSSHRRFSFQSGPLELLVLSGQLRDVLQELLLAELKRRILQLQVFDLDAGSGNAHSCTILVAKSWNNYY